MNPRVRAPEFPQSFTWLNCDRPLSLKALKGRIIILDFWTYCCINCIHVLPDLKFLEQKYQDKLTVIGVHSAKFENEKETENIRQAILRYDIEHPVIVDRNFEIWQQYAIRAWPTLVVIDPQGYAIASMSGEGNRDRLDELIAKLIENHDRTGAIAVPEIHTLLEKHRQPLVTPLAFPGKVFADKKSDRLFIADSGHHRIVVSTLDGKIQQIIGNGKPGLTDGNFAEAQFFSPQGMTLDRHLLYVADTENHAIRAIDLSAETVTTLAGTGKQSRYLHPHGGEGLDIPLNSPWDLELIDDEILAIAMAGSHQIWALDLMTGNIGTYAGMGAEACIDGELSESAFAQPSGIATDGKELFVADSETSTIRVVGLDENATVRTLCGSGDLFGFGDASGIGDRVLLQHCIGIEYANGYLWIADTYNHKIKRANPKTGLCETALGKGTPGWQDGIGIDTQFNEPSGLSAAASQLYIADTNNHRIRQVNLHTLEVITLEFPGLCSPEACVPT